MRACELLSFLASMPAIEDPGAGPDDACAFEVEERERCRQAALTGVRLAVPIVLAFGAIDAVAFPNNVAWFLLLRVGVVAILLVILRLLGRPDGRRHAYALAFTGVAAIGGMLVLMTMVTGGSGSPYYGGLNLTIVAMALVIAWPPAWSVAASLVIIGTYVVALLSGPPTAAAHPGRLMINLGFLVTTAILAFVSSTFQRRLRREAFDRRINLERAMRDRQAFLANVSHELRSPLHVTMGYADILLDGVLAHDPAEARRLVERIRDRSLSLHHLINELLDYAKVDAGKMHVHATPLRAEAVALRVAESFLPVATREGLVLETRVASEVPLVMADPQRLEQILVNFVANALKFTRVGTIVIDVGPAPDGATLAHAGYRSLSGTSEGPTTLEPCGAWVLVAVHDTGIGIRAGDLASLAEDFRQLDEAASDFGGTGLGLSVSRRLADLLGARLVVRSRHGVGSTFGVLLQVAGVSSRAAA